MLRTAVVANVNGVDTLLLQDAHLKSKNTCVASPTFFFFFFADSSNRSRTGVLPLYFSCTILLNCAILQPHLEKSKCAPPCDGLFGLWCSHYTAVWQSDSSFGRPKDRDNRVSGGGKEKGKHFAQGRCSWRVLPGFRSLSKMNFAQGERRKNMTWTCV